MCVYYIWFTELNRLNGAPTYICAICCAPWCFNRPFHLLIKKSIWKFSFWPIMLIALSVINTLWLFYPHWIRSFILNRLIKLFRVWNEGVCAKIYMWIWTLASSNTHSDRDASVRVRVRIYVKAKANAQHTTHNTTSPASQQNLFAFSVFAFRNLNILVRYMYCTENKQKIVGS